MRKRCATCCRTTRVITRRATIAARSLSPPPACVCLNAAAQRTAYTARRVVGQRRILYRRLPAVRYCCSSVLTQRWDCCSRMDCACYRISSRLNPMEALPATVGTAHTRQLYYVDYHSSLLVYQFIIRQAGWDRHVIASMFWFQPTHARGTRTRCGDALPRTPGTAARRFRALHTTWFSSP